MGGDVGSVDVVSVGLGDAGLVSWAGPGGGLSWTGVTVHLPKPVRAAGCWSRTQGSPGGLGVSCQILSHERDEATELLGRGLGASKAWPAPRWNWLSSQESLAGCPLPGTHFPAETVWATDSDDTPEATHPVLGHGSKVPGELRPEVMGEAQPNLVMALGGGRGLLPSES